MKSEVTMTEQRTPEWYAQRKMRITGSRIGAVLGLNSFKTANDVMREMVREYHGYPSEFTGNIATEHGNSHERQAILAFMREADLFVEECGFYPYGDFLGASPDGVGTYHDGRKFVLEIKVPFSLRKKENVEFKTLTEQPSYYAQAQMEIIAAQADFAFFMQYVPQFKNELGVEIDEQIKIDIVAKDEHWLDNNFTKLTEFYDLLQLELGNPAHLEPLIITLNTQETLDIVKQIDAIKARIKRDQDAEKVLMNRLADLTKGKNATIHGRKFTLVSKQGAISYAKAVNDLMPNADLEAYRGKPTSYWKLS